MGGGSIKKNKKLYIDLNVKKGVALLKKNGIAMEAMDLFQRKVKRWVQADVLKNKLLRQQRAEEVVELERKRKITDKNVKLKIKKNANHRAQKYKNKRSEVKNPKTSVSSKEAVKCVERHGLITKKRVCNKKISQNRKESSHQVVIKTENDGIHIVKKLVRHKLKTVCNCSDENISNEIVRKEAKEKMKEGTRKNIVKNPVNKNEAANKIAKKTAKGNVRKTVIKARKA